MPFRQAKSLAGMAFPSICTFLNSQGMNFFDKLNPLPVGRGSVYQ